MRCDCRPPGQRSRLHVYLERLLGCYCLAKSRPDSRPHSGWLLAIASLGSVISMPSRCAPDTFVPGSTLDCMSALSVSLVASVRPEGDDLPIHAPVDEQRLEVPLVRSVSGHLAHRFHATPRPGDMQLKECSALLSQRLRFGSGSPAVNDRRYHLFRRQMYGQWPHLRQQP